MERAFEDEMKKVLMYTKGFKPEHRTKLADVTAIFLVQVMASPGFLWFVAFFNNNNNNNNNNNSKKKTRLTIVFFHFYRCHLWCPREF